MSNIFKFREGQKFDTSNITSLYRTFDGCKEITAIPAMDTSNVTTFEGMCCNCAKLKTVPKMDTSKAKKMNEMFVGCDLPEEFPWAIDCSSIETLEAMSCFMLCDSVKKVTLKNVKKELQAEFTAEKLQCPNLTTIEFI